jgi:RNA polymerase sigma factor (sigma-70 family)
MPDDSKQLLLANLGLVKWWAHRVSNSLGLDYDDAYGEMILHVWKKLPLFDKSKGSFPPWLSQLCRYKTHYIFARWKRQKRKARTEAWMEHHAYRHPTSTVVYKDLIARLTPRQQLVVRLRLERDLYWREIGAMIGCCWERARQIYKEAIQELREVTKDG